MVDENTTAAEGCPNCNVPVEGGALQSCMICRTLFCQRCAVRGYGREFCSDTCRAMFFFGDADDMDDLKEED